MFTDTLQYNGSIQYLEHVVVIATLSTDANGTRGDIQLELASPFGTLSRILPYRINDSVPGVYTSWPFMSLHFWGEDPEGNWSLVAMFQGVSGSATIQNVTITLYGTASIPESVSRIPPNCDPACARGCAAAGPEFCDACVNLRNAETLECITQCPAGFTERYRYCYNASIPEPQCARNITGKFLGVIMKT